MMNILIKILGFEHNGFWDGLEENENIMDKIKNLFGMISKITKQNFEIDFESSNISEDNHNGNYEFMGELKISF